MCAHPTPALRQCTHTIPQNCSALQDLQEDKAPHQTRNPSAASLGVSRDGSVTRSVAQGAFMICVSRGQRSRLTSSSCVRVAQSMACGDGSLHRGSVADSSVVAVKNALRKHHIGQRRHQENVSRCEADGPPRMQASEIMREIATRLATLPSPSRPNHKPSQSDIQSIPLASRPPHARALFALQVSS